MLSRSDRLRLLAVIITAVIVITGIGWWLWPTDFEPAPSHVSQAVDVKKQKMPTANVEPTKAYAATTTMSDALPKTSGAPTVESILSDQTIDNIAAARALGVLVQDSTLTSSAREEALAHMLNLSVNHETELLLPLLKSPQLPDSLAATILDDALNRPLEWQADACLAIMARKTGKDLHTQASDHLAFLTGEDHGDDLSAWILAIQTARNKWATAGQ